MDTTKTPLSDIVVPNPILPILQDIEEIFALLGENFDPTRSIHYFVGFRAIQQDDLEIAQINFEKSIREWQKEWLKLVAMESSKKKPAPSAIAEQERIEKSYHRAYYCAREDFLFARAKEELMRVVPEMFLDEDARRFTVSAIRRVRIYLGIDGN